MQLFLSVMNLFTFTYKIKQYKEEPMIQEALITAYFARLSVIYLNYSRKNNFLKLQNTDFFLEQCS